MLKPFMGCVGVAYGHSAIFEVHGASANAFPQNI